MYKKQATNLIACSIYRQPSSFEIALSCIYALKLPSCPHKLILLLLAD